MEKYVPFPLYYDDMPIDISFVFESERPAGKHGFIKTAGDHFEFEDGTKARFWGVNFNGGPASRHTNTLSLSQKDSKNRMQYRPLSPARRRMGLP